MNHDLEDYFVSFTVTRCIHVIVQWDCSQRYKSTWLWGFQTVQVPPFTADKIQRQRDVWWGDKEFQWGWYREDRRLPSQRRCPKCCTYFQVYISKMWGKGGWVRAREQWRSNLLLCWNQSRVVSCWLRAVLIAWGGCFDCSLGMLCLQALLPEPRQAGKENATRKVWGQMKWTKSSFRTSRISGTFLFCPSPFLAAYELDVMVRVPASIADHVSGEERKILGPWCLWSYHECGLHIPEFHLYERTKETICV